MDQVSEQHLAQVIPVLADKVHAAAATLAAQGVYFRVAQGLRTYEEQDALYAEGRTVHFDAHGKPLRVVTDAPGGWSNHNFGCAVDCYPFIHGDSGALDLTNPEAPEFLAMVAAMKDQGLAWGGDWHSIHDAPHFQLANVPVTPTDADRDAFEAGGLAAVWAQYA